MNNFLELKPGSNVVRLISKPYAYMAHSDLKIKGAPNYGQKMMCHYDPNRCRFCNNGKKNSRRFIVALIDRQTNNIKLFDFSGAVFLELAKYAKDPQWGDPIKYDFDLYMDCNYDIDPKVRPPMPMSDTDKIMANEFDKHILAHVTNYTNCDDKINTAPFEIINWQENWI